MQVAVGFHRLGPVRRNAGNQKVALSRNEVLTEMTDAVGLVFMGITVNCARCHDHKFDPISMRDYYGLYGVFASSSEPAEKPLLGASAMPKEFSEYEAERKKREEERDTFRQEKEDEVYTHQPFYRNNIRRGVWAPAFAGVTPRGVT